MCHEKNKRPVRFTGQHFTIDKALIANAIRVANLSPDDTVLDIGAGKASFTVPLAQYCKNVIAIENDSALLEILRKKFSKSAGVSVVAKDFREYTLPQKRFKVVSNIPYRITSEILKSLLFTNMECCRGGVLIMQLQTAQQLVSERLFDPYKIYYRTFFELRLLYEVPPESFLPPPTVWSALLRIRKKDLVFPARHKARYLSFLFFLLKKPDIPARTALKTVFRKSQVRELAEKYGILLSLPVVTLSPPQWWGCFLYLLERVPERFHPSQ